MAYALSQWRVDVVHLHGIDFHTAVPDAPVPLVASRTCPSRGVSLDNDCLLWTIPPAVTRWLEGAEEWMLVAEDGGVC